MTADDHAAPGERNEPMRVLRAVTVALALAAILTASIALTGCGRTRVYTSVHVHDEFCGHYYSGSTWVYHDGHVHRRGCGHYYHDGWWWSSPPAVTVVYSSGHVCSYSCGHYYWRGRTVYHRGHTHGRGCGHRYSGGVWIRF